MPRTCDCSPPHLIDIYDTINHYLKGMALIDTKGKNVETAKLFLRTARKAKTLRAFSAGHLLLKNAVDRLVSCFRFLYFALTLSFSSSVRCVFCFVLTLLLLSSTHLCSADF